MTEQNLQKICHLLSTGMTFEEVAKIAGVSVSEVESIRNKYKAKCLNDECIQEICRSLSMGMTVEDVAKYEEMAVSEVEAIKIKYADDIQERIKYRKEVYGVDYSFNG